MKIKHAMITAFLMGLAQVSFAAPDTWVQSITYNSETITMRLTKENLRGSNFELWSQNASGGYDVVTPVAERSYIGTVDEYPGAVSCGILQDDGTFKGAVYFDRGGTWFTRGTSVVETRALEYSDFSSFQYPTAPTVAAGQAGSTMVAYELGVDVDYNYFSDAGSIAKALEGIEYSVCLIRAIYMRDVLLRTYLGRVIIRATLAQDPYTGYSQDAYLLELRSEWENNHTDTNPDLVCGSSPTKIGGGLGFVGFVGASYGYSVSSCDSSGNFSIVARHEMGHNWGCSHFEGGLPEGAGIMGGNQPARFSGCEVHTILAHRDSRAAGILDDEGIYTAVELPPYASMDVGTYIQGNTSSLTLDVLANDHDANGQTLSLFSYDDTSANGGTIAQQGQNLAYTAPGGFLGSDYFMYTTTDTAGKTASGVVIVDIQANEPLQLYLPLDETTGTTMADESSFNRSGQVQNGAIVGVAGHLGNAVTMDGMNDTIDIEDLDLNANTVTLSAWIKRPSGTQDNAARIIFNDAGLRFGSANELRYNWNGSNYTWDSGLVPPANQWVFVALVIEPTQATIYMHDGTTLQSAVHTGTHTAEAFTGTTSIGGSGVYYEGDIDEIRIHNTSLTQAQILELVAGGKAERPNPFDGATGVDFSLLRWSAGAAATGHDVYFGTNPAAVASATKASPEYQGTTSENYFPATVSPQTPYYWRIDTVTASTTLPGSVWTFTTSNDILEPDLDPNVVAHWKLDDGSGTIAADASLHGNTGVLNNGLYWTNGVANGALQFDGLDDAVTFGTGPSLSGPTDFTLSAWIKTSSATDQVILQQRDNGATGYNGEYVFKVLANGTLNFFVFKDGYQFNFSTTATVNDGQWHFVSAVRDGMNGYLYIDGNSTPAASASGPIKDLVATISVGMGRDTRDKNQPFNGLIDEVVIYNIAKSGSELAAIVNSYSDNDGDGLPDASDPDDDNDGIPDTWEIARGLNPLVDDATANPDSDVYDNWHEYMTDTDPLDGNAFQTVSFEIDPGSGEPTIRFSSSVNRFYVVEYRDDLASGSWQGLSSFASLFPGFGTRYAGTGSEITVSDSTIVPQRYYRIRVELP